MELKLTTFLIFRRRGSVIPTIHTLRQRGVSIFDIIKLVYLLFQPHVSSGTHLCHGCLPHMPRSTVTCAGCAEGQKSHKISAPNSLSKPRTLISYYGNSELWHNHNFVCAHLPCTKPRSKIRWEKTLVFGNCIFAKLLITTPDPYPCSLPLLTLQFPFCPVPSLFICSVFIAELSPVYYRVWMRQMVYMSVQALQGAANAQFWNISERQNCVHLTLLKH